MSDDASKHIAFLDELPSVESDDLVAFFAEEDGFDMIVRDPHHFTYRYVPDHVSDGSDANMLAALAARSKRKDYVNRSWSWTPNKRDRRPKR